MTFKRPFSHWLLLGTIVVLWGSAFGVTELAIEAFTPATLVAGRLIVAAVVLTLIVWLRGRKLPRSRRFWLFSLAMAIAGNCLPFWLISRAQLTIDSGLAGILMSIMPLSTLVLAHFFVPNEQLNRQKLVGCLLGLVGIVVLIGPEALLELRGQGTALFAELATLFAALCYAANAVIARHRPSFDPITAAAGIMIVGAVIMLPLGAAGLPEQIAGASIKGLAAGLALAIMASAVAPVVFLQLVTLAGPSFVAFLNYLIPLWAIFIGITLLGEQPKWTALLALCLILFGLAMSERAWRRQKTEDARRQQDGRADAA
jgi:drug/metabolite transporter (DMT)-like permease